LDERLTHDLPQRLRKQDYSGGRSCRFAWAYLMALAKRNGRRLGSMVATAVTHPLTLATRNIKDLEGFRNKNQ